MACRSLISRRAGAHLRTRLRLRRARPRRRSAQRPTIPAYIISAEALLLQSNRFIKAQQILLSVTFDLRLALVAMIIKHQQ